MMIFILKTIFLFHLTVLFWGCASKSKIETEGVPGGVTDTVAGQWEAKAMIKSLESGEANVVGLDVIGLKPNTIRMEVSSSLGIALASIIIRNQDVEYVLPKQKKYYHGSISEQSLYPALNVKISPELLSAVFFEESYPKWNCQADNGLIVSCTTPEGVKIQWERDGKSTKRISLSSSKFEVQVQMKNYKLKSNWAENTWAIQVPEGFKRYRLK